MKLKTAGGAAFEVGPKRDVTACSRARLSRVNAIPNRDYEGAVAKISCQAGITLIEVLIAVSLLSLLSVGMLTAMRIGFNTMDKTDTHLVHNRRVANARKILENEISGFTFTRAVWHPAPQVMQSVPFAQWGPSAMRFVTSYSLQDSFRGRPQIAALQVIPGDGGVGFRLIVDETPYTGQAQAGQLIAGIENNIAHFAPIQIGPQSFVLADRLAYCRFSYQEQRYQPPFRVWRADWITPWLIPRGIRIQMAPLDRTSGEADVIDATIPIRVDRTLDAEYYDAQ
jgi:general secretion pathway protein J